MMRTDRIKLKLSEKGILVVAMTLIFQLCFVLALALLLQGAHEQTQKERHVREEIAQLNKIASIVDNLTIGLTQEITSPDPENSPEFYRTYGQFLDKVPRQMKLLEDMTANERRGPMFQELGHTLREGTAAVDRYRRAHINRLAQRDYFALAVKDISLKKTQQVDELISSLEADQNVERQAEIKAHNGVLIFLGAGVLANIFLAVALMVAFTRAISRRVDKVRDNAVRLTAGVPLRAVSKEDDELGLLDQTFHQMAASLAESVQREQALVTNAVDVILSVSEKGKCVSINPACKTLLGFEPESIVGRHVLELVEDREKEKTSDAFKQAIKANEPLKFENVLKTADGRAIDAGWSIFWSPENKTHFCVVHDISQRKQVERLKRDFVAMVSHDLRAPLSSIQLVLQNCINGTLGVLPDLAKERVGMASSSVDRLIGLVNGLVSIEKLESGEMELSVAGLRASEIVEPAIHSVQGLASRKHVEIRLGSGGSSYLYADKERLIQVIVNLLSNAVKFSPEQSEIVVSVAQTAAATRFEVIDQGRGVPEEMREAIFDRFKQVSRSDEMEKGGSGLGLSICKSIVESHGGTIGVTSTNGKGSTFWFEIPSASDDDDDDD